jgi:hypothetical protein
MLAELNIRPLNHSLIFMNERMFVILSNDQWRFAVNVNLSMYHEVLSTVMSDLLAVNREKSLRQFPKLD